MEDIMCITPLGSGQEVGRSCHLLKFLNKTILLDCGIHPGYEGVHGLPYFDTIDPESVDVLLISHFHLDHAASLPYFTERTGFSGRIFMTHPTKAVTRLLLGDYLRLIHIQQKQQGLSNDTNDSMTLYTEEELQACVDKIELIDYHQRITIGGLKFHALNAGHVLGAAMFVLEIGGRTVLYTGDYSMEEDRHLLAAELPPVKPDVLIVESTYGVQVHASRAEREALFTGTIERVVKRGGRCLLPVFALGRTQELLLILEEYWKKNPQLQSIPIWYASKLANRALRVYQTYANMMNYNIRAHMDVGNPFEFKFINNLKGIDVDQFDDRGPCVVFASPGMLQSGTSRQLFDRWASDPKNGCLIAGYAVEHTLAKEILKAPKEVVTLEGRKQPLNCLVDYVSFSAHVDFMQNRNFITKVDPKHIILVHGQKDEMGRLKNALLLQYRKLPENKRPSVTMPPNNQEVKLKFTRRRSAKVMGLLADREMEPQAGELVQGILVTQNFNSKIVSANDLATYTPLRVGSVTSKLHVPFVGKVQLIKFFLLEMFQDVEEIIALKELNCNKLTESNIHVDNELRNKLYTFALHNQQVNLTLGQTPNMAIIEWNAGPAEDIIADSVVALLMQAQTNPAAIQMSSQLCNHRRRRASVNRNEKDDVKKRKDTEIKTEKETKINPTITTEEFLMKIIYETLSEQFETVEATYEKRHATFQIITDSGLEVELTEDESLICNVTLEFIGGGGTDTKITVESRDSKLANNIRECLRNVAFAAKPLSM